jgi:metal-dependent amidase/aminoacylase/carboxypeptidase family protein
LRVFEPTVRERLLRRIDELVHDVPALSGVESAIEPTDCCPACVNDPRMAELVQRVARRVLGDECVTSTTRTMGAEDMSLFLNAVPGCFFFVGSANAEKGLASPHHSPAFDFDEAALEVGVNVLSSVALEYLGQ